MKDSISNNVQEFRNKRNMTQEELARLSGVSRQTIIAIEKGDYIPSVLLALKIARVFRRPAEDLFNISNEK